MEPKFRTSFIPKQSLKARVEKKRRGGATSIVMLVALIIFLGSLALSLGVFLYQQFLIQSIAQKETSFERAQAAFEPALINELSRLDTRITSAGDVLGKHVAMSQFFDLLEQATLKSVRFKDFRYNASGDGRSSIALSGEADSFAAVALQSDAFGQSRFIREPIFSNLDLDNKGNVIFDFSAFVDPSLISYTRGVTE